MEAVPSSDAVCFGPFKLDVRAGELHKVGRKIRLQEQPFKLLRMLLARQGEVVTREEIRQQLWPNDTIVEFDHSISTAMGKLRLALGDSAEKPLYVETVARRGYRLLVPVEWEQTRPASPAAEVQSSFESETAVGKLVGKRVSHYRILGLLGGGGMGVVYQAEDLKLARRVALKFLPEELGTDARALERFEQEARAASTLDHTNICTIYEFGEHEDQPFIVMQLLEGETLRDRMARGGSFPIGKLLDLAIQIAAGLEAAHEKGVIHRDIKPANIFVTDQGQAKILDFGLAKLTNDQGGRCPPCAGEGRTGDNGSARHVRQQPGAPEGALQSRTGLAMGTAAYMSPEQIQGEKVDLRTDLFSFGLVLYEMTTGRQAFAGDSVVSLHEAILGGTPTAVCELNPKLPTQLEKIVNQLLQKQPQRRYQTAQDLENDLRRVRDELAFSLRGLQGITTTSQDRTELSASRVGSIDLVSRQTRRTRQATYLLLATLILAGAGLSLFGLTPVPPPKVLGIAQITNDGQQKDDGFVADSSRLYLTEFLDERSLLQVSVMGGETVPFPVRLPNPGIDDISPSGSGLFVFSAEGPPPRPYWFVPLPGGSPRRLGDVKGQDVHGSPDGQQIAYFTGSDLYLAQADGTRPRKLLTVPGTAPGWASWAPDGSKLRFDMDDPRSGTHSIWEVASDGSNLHPVLSGWNKQGLQLLGRWTPDGKYFIFQLSPNRVTHQLWAIREKGSLWRRVNHDPVQLTTGTVQFRSPVPSKDGKKIFAIGDQVRSEIMRYAPQSQEWVSYHLGKSMVHLDFSKDGEWIAYVAHPEDTLWRSRKDFSDSQQLTFSPLKVEHPRWSPDRKQISFQGKIPGKPWKIYIVSSSGGNPQELIRGDRNETIPDWSPDGSRLAFGGPYVSQPETSEGPAPIQILDLRTKKASVLPGADGLLSPRWSRDGRYLVAIRFALDGLMLFDFVTRKWEQLAKGDCRFVNWSRDGRYVYFERWDKKDSAAVRIGIHNRKEDRIASVKTFMAARIWFGLAPDDSLLVLRDVGSQEIYAIDWEAP